MRINRVKIVQGMYEFIIDGRRFWPGVDSYVQDRGYALFLMEKEDEEWLSINGESIPADLDNQVDELASMGELFFTSDPVLVALTLEARDFYAEGSPRSVNSKITIPTVFEAIEIVKNRIILEECNLNWAGRVPGLEKYCSVSIKSRNVYREVQNPALYERAREMRLNPTPAEAQLWQALRRRRLDGFKFRQQAPFGQYIVDFYCPAARLVVEVDGAQHLDQAEYDEARTLWLENKGLRVIRFRNEDVLLRLEWVLSEIEKALSPGPSPVFGRGEPARG